MNWHTYFLFCNGTLWAVIRSTWIDQSNDTQGPNDVMNACSIYQDRSKPTMPRKTIKFYFSGLLQIFINGDVMFAFSQFMANPHLWVCDACVLSPYCRFMNGGSPHLLCCLEFLKLLNHYETSGAEKGYLLSLRIFTGPWLVGPWLPMTPPTWYKKGGDLTSFLHFYLDPLRETKALPLLSESLFFKLPRPSTASSVCKFSFSFFFFYPLILLPFL